MLDLRQNDGQMENIQLQGRWRTKRARKLRWRRRQREGQDNAKETKHTFDIRQTKSPVAYRD